MKVSVDRDQCISCALCWTSCPAIFAEDQADGKCSIVEIAHGEASEALRPSAQEAADNCPVSIIHIA
jgi:ferredoxin